MKKLIALLFAAVMMTGTVLAQDPGPLTSTNNFKADIYCDYSLWPEDANSKYIGAYVAGGNYATPTKTHLFRLTGQCDGLDIGYVGGPSEAVYHVTHNGISDATYAGGWKIFSNSSNRVRLWVLWEYSKDDKGSWKNFGTTQEDDVSLTEPAGEGDCNCRYWWRVTSKHIEIQGNADPGVYQFDVVVTADLNGV